MHKIVRASARGCPLPGLRYPTASSGFADDTNLHTMGADAIPALKEILRRVGPFLQWIDHTIYQYEEIFPPAG